MLFVDPSEGLSSLSPADQAIAELKALLAGTVSKGDFVHIVRALNIPRPEGKTWSAQKIIESIDRLIRKRILGPDGEIASAWREPLVLRVLARPDGAALLEAVRAAAPQSPREHGYYWAARPVEQDVDLARSIRLLALGNRAEEVERLIEIADRSARESGPRLPLSTLLLRGLPADLGFIDALAPGLRDRVAAAHVEFLLEEGVCDEGVEATIAVLRQGDRDWAAAPRLDRALLRLDLLGEQPHAARVRIERLRASDPVTALAAEAALAFLTSSGAESLPCFREALKLHRKESGWRRAALPGEFGVLHVLALFAADQPTSRKDIANLLEGLAAVRPMAAAGFAALLDLVSANEAPAKRWAAQIAAMPVNSRRREPPLDAAVVNLALAAIDGAGLAEREGEDWRSAARWGGPARLAARINAEVHARGAAHQERWLGELERLGPGYERRFLDIVPVRPAWERVLDRLQNLLAAPAKADAAAQSRRLIFLFEADTLAITPLEQTSKRDGWSAGRPVSLKRLHKRDAKLDYLTPEDHRVLAAIETRYSYYADDYVFNHIRGPMALIGHPRVFDADFPERQVELIGYPLELVVHEEGEVMRIELSVRTGEPRVIVERETPTRWRVIEVTAAMVELGAVLGPKGLEAPKAARERVVALVKTENPRLPVRSELAGVSTRTAEGDATPVLQIAPEDGGFTIEARVRPLGDDGPAYIPGLGAQSVLAPAGGSHVRINRDLAAETAALEVVADACPALGSWRENDQTWRIESLDAALEVLQQLHAFDGRLRLEWPKGKAIRPTRNVDASALSLNISSGRDWFEMTGKVQAEEDLVLDMAELLARLSPGGGRFVALDDGRYLALTDDLRRRLGAFAAVTETVKGGRRIGVAGAGAVEDLVSAAGAVNADRRWTDLIGKLAAAQRFEPVLPQGFDADMRDYQRQGFDWLARLSRLGLGACLADDMGLGKTVQALALLLNDAPKGPSLVVAPTSVCHNWALEATRFAPGLRVRMLVTAPDRAALVAGLGPGDLLVASYGLLHTEIERLASRRFAVAVFDEAQNLKNAETRRAKAGKRIDADFRLALTGTPVENRLEELWSLYDTVTPGLLGTRESFHRRFAGPIERGDASHARQALKSLVRPFLLRRTKAAVLAELPSRTEITLEIEPGPEERAFSEALRRKAIATLSTPTGPRGQNRIRILAEITRLRRAACNPALIDPAAGIESAKLAALLELTAELKANRHRALVFSQFTGHLDLVEAALREADARLLRLDGSTPAKERAQRVAAFQAGEGDLFLISLKAGGTGLNLTGADYVIHLDPWWNPAVEDQATDRAHRIGQVLPVTVYRLVLKDSIEEKILALHDAKRALSADFLDGADQAGALDEEQLMTLIRG